MLKVLSRARKLAGRTIMPKRADERDDLILNLVNTLKQCNRDIQARMVEHFTQADPEYGFRVREKLEQSKDM